MRINGKQAGCAILLAMLAACATRQPAPPPSRPAPPQALSPIHQQLSPLETVWHVRAGLNVAALSCAGRVGPAIVTDYNAFLADKKQLLAAAYAAKSDKYRAQGGNWQRAMDQDMTRLYNHFASPTAQAAFCDAAALEVKRALAENPQAFEAAAADALARLDGPFTGQPGPPLLRTASLAAAPPPAAPGARSLPAPPITIPPATAPLPANWRIQLGAFSSTAAAQSAWSQVKARSPGLAAFTPLFQPVPGRNLVRLQLAASNDRADAIQLCALASSAGFDCIPVRAS